MPLDPGLKVLEEYSDRQIIAMPDFAGPQVSVVLAASQGAQLSGTVLGKNAAGKYEIFDDTDAASEPVILAESLDDQTGDVSVRAYLGGVFYTAMLVGMSATAKTALGARVVNDITVVPV